MPINCIDNASMNLARECDLDSVFASRVLVATGGSGSKAVIILDRDFTRCLENQADAQVDVGPCLEGKFLLA